MALGDGGARDLELVEVIEHPSERTHPEAPTSFSVEFRGAPDEVLPQSTYRLHHETMGDLDLFLVPVGPDGVGMRYESLFNYDALRGKGGN